MTREPISPSLAKAAIGHPPTAVGYRSLVLKRRLWLTGMLLLGVAVGCTAYEQPSSRRVGFIVIAAVAYPPCLFVVALASRRTKRVAAILGTYAWGVYPCTYPRRSVDSPKSIAITFADGYRPVLRLIQYSGNLAQKQNPAPDTIWFAGDPRYGGVVSPVGGHFPVRVVPEDMGDSVPHGSPEDDALAERAELVREGKVRKT